MSEKRKLLDQSPDGSSSTKHQKKWDQWNDDKVTRIKNYLSHGVKEVFSFQSKETCDRSFGEIKLAIKCTENLQIGPTTFLYYTGFKNGLTYLLNEIQELHDDFKAIIIHGIPRVGKTSLAHNLAYHLASNDSTAMVVTMDNEKNISRDTVTERLSDFCLQPGWVIIDQVNVHKIDKTRLVQALHASKRKNPLIIFTSGHYAPPDPTWNDGQFLLKVIDMRIDEAGVQFLKKEFKAENIKTADLLQVTRVFGHVLDIILSVEKGSPVTFDELRTRVYQQVEFSDFLSRNLNILWILWPAFCNASTETICEKNKPEDWKIEPSQVELLRYALNNEVDRQNQKTRLFANWLYIGGDGKCNQNEEEGFYVHTEYFYYFPFVEKLHDCIRKANEISPEKRLEAMKIEFREHSKSTDCSARSIKGHYFEEIIRLECRLHSKAKTGIIMDGKRGVAFVEVDDVLQPSSVNELCRIVEEKRIASTEREQFWCDLSLGNRQFPGFDFASVQVEEGKYLLFELFQVTVSPEGHGRGTMVKVLKEIERKVYKPDTFKGKVVPYFLCPFDSGRAKEYVNVGNKQVQVINMVEF